MVVDSRARWLRIGQLDGWRLGRVADSARRGPRLASGLGPDHPQHPGSGAAVCSLALGAAAATTLWITRCQDVVAHGVDGSNIY